MRENDDQTDIIRSIKAEGGFSKKWASRFGVGNPDLICALPGIGIFLLEVKTPEGKLSPKQVFELEEWRKGGGKVYVAIVDRKKHVEINGRLCQWLPNLQIYEGITAALNKKAKQ